MLFSKVLVVEDTKTNLQMITDMLETEGYEIIAAKNGAEAMAALAKDPPALILLDVQLPGKNGFEICREIKANPAYENIPVIMMTGVYKDPHYQAKALLNCRANDFLKKPFTKEDLILKVKKVLE